MPEFSDEQIRELAEDPNLESVHTGRLVTDQVLFCVYDRSFLESVSITMEAEEEVLVTKHRDGTYFMHFMSMTPKMYHYKAPWISDDQVTYDEGAIYHV